MHENHYEILVMSLELLENPWKHKTYVHSETGGNQIKSLRNTSWKSCKAIKSFLMAIGRMECQ